MLPDIRVVVTAIATTVLILVGIGLMASIRLTHQSLSAQSDPPVTTRMSWRQPEPTRTDGALAGHAPARPEPVLNLPHETMDLTTLTAEERSLAERVMASAPPQRYAAASLDPAESPQLAARVAEDSARAHPADQSEPPTTASVSSKPDPKTSVKKEATAKPVPPSAAKLHARTGKPKRTARRSARAKQTDKNGFESFFGFDSTQ